MSTTTVEAVAEDLDLDARKKKGIVLQVADLVYLVGTNGQDLGHVARIEGAGCYVTWPRGKHGLHTSADLVLVAS